jgi:hypothetical protein
MANRLDLSLPKPVLLTTNTPSLLQRDHTAHSTTIALKLKKAPGNANNKIRIPQSCRLLSRVNQIMRDPIVPLAVVKPRRKIFASHQSPLPVERNQHQTTHPALPHLHIQTFNPHRHNLASLQCPEPHHHEQAPVKMAEEIQCLLEISWTHDDPRILKSIGVCWAVWTGRVNNCFDFTSLADLSRLEDKPEDVPRMTKTSEVQLIVYGGRFA